MTYKKRYKYRKTIKRKKRGGAAFLKGLSAAKGAAESAKGASSGLTGAMPQVEGIKNPLTQTGPNAASTNAGAAGAAGLGGLASGAGVAGGAGAAGLAGGAEGLKGAAGKLAGFKGKASPSPYIIIAEFILKQTSKANMNYALASKIFKSPTLRENKYKKIINALKPQYIENFKCGCKLIYLYFYDEYATNFSFMIDNSQDMDNICKMLHVINQQTIIYNSSKNKLLSHFNIIFENNNFSNLYKKNLTNVETDCNIMRHKIQGLFKRDDKNYSYIIIDLLYDLLHQSSITFINIMDELKTNNQKKMCDISTEMNNILDNCKQKEQYEAGMDLLHPENLLMKEALKAQI